jgi:zinc transporter 2
MGSAASTATAGTGTATANSRRSHGQYHDVDDHDDHSHRDHDHTRCGGGSGHDHSHDHDHDHNHNPHPNNAKDLVVASKGAADDPPPLTDDTKTQNEKEAVFSNADDLERMNAMNRLKVATVLCLTFFGVEVVGGYLAGSLAVLSDAAHLFSDLASFAVAIFANYLASLPSTSLHTFGLKRSESLAALFSMVSLALVCVWLGVEAVKRLYCMVFWPDLAASLYEVDGRLMSGIAAIGVSVNLVLAWVLGAEGHVHMPGSGGCSGDHHGHSHSHSHSHNHGNCNSGKKGQNDHHHGHDHQSSTTTATIYLEEGTHGRDCTEQSSLLANSSRDESPHRHHQYTVEHINEVPPPTTPPPPAKRRNVNLQAAYLHVLGDLAQSVAVLVAGIVIWFRPAWIVVDPICTLGFCIAVFHTTLGVVRSSMVVLLEEVPPQINWQSIYRDLTSIPHLTDVHDLHIWCISDGVPSLSLHASCDDGHCENALKSITAVCQKYGIVHITAQVRHYEMGVFFFRDFCFLRRNCLCAPCVVPDARSHRFLFCSKLKLSAISRLACVSLQVQPWEGDCITCEHVVNNPCFESMHD